MTEAARMLATGPTHGADGMAIDPRKMIEARLGARYRAERRFRFYGLAAIGVAIAALLVLVGSIGANAYSAFFQYELALDIEVDPARAEAGDYGVMLQEALRAEFPQETDSARVRDLLALYTRLNAARLERRVESDPSLVGGAIRFTMPIADEIDRYLKGEVTDREWVNLDTLAVIGAGSVTFAGDDAARIAGEADVTGLLGEGSPSAILFQDGGAWRLGAVGAAVPAAQLVAPTGSGADGRVLLLATPEADRRVSDDQIAWTEILRERDDVKAAFNTTLFTSADSREPELAGVLAALIGSIFTMLVTMVLAVPVGIATAIYLEEFAPKNRWTDLVEVNINNLAAVPSIVFGLLGLAVFINFFGLPRSAPLLGGLVLALMTLPVVIIASRAALKAVPPSIREAALAVGASQTQAVFGHVLPLAVPGIMTGSIIGLARAMGETAPLLMIGMVAFVADVPSSITSPSTVMPVQVYIWGTSAERAFEARTAAAIIILLTLMVVMNGVAIFVRRKFERRW